MQVRRIVPVVVLAAVVILAFASPAFAEGPARKIVLFERGGVNANAIKGLKAHGATVVKELPLVDGVAVTVPDEAVAKGLLKVAGVKSVEVDHIVHALKRPAPTQPGEEVQWGVTRIGAPLVWWFTTADPVKVGIIDTGIDVDHPDLVDNIKGGVSCVSYTSKYDDDNGHGTHVAGIVAAVDNEVGVIGVAPQADLYGIKVLNRKGSGYTSDIIEGLDWAIANGLKVVNMSLGSDYYDSAFALAIQRTVAANVVPVCAAGNDGPEPVDYPGAYPGAIAVGATDVNNVIASWSSVGPEVSVCAPGVSIYSTYKGGGYATMSGTSMASPHVAGSAALVVTQPDPNGDGVWTPAEVKTRLQNSALDLGPAGFDNSYGYGLVQADDAVNW